MSGILHSAFCVLSSEFSQRVRPAIGRRVLGIVLCLCSVVSAAQRLTVEDCVRLGLANSPTLVASQAGIDYADAKSLEASTARLPSLTLTGAYTRLSPISPFVFDIPVPGKAPVAETVVPSINNNYQAKLSLQQPLFTGLRLQNASAIAAENARAARTDFARDKNQLLLDIRSAYWGLYQAVQAETLVQQNRRRMQVHLADIRNRQRVGLATLNDVLKVRVQAANVALTEVETHNAIQVATTALDNLVGLPLDTEVEPASEPGGAGAGGGDSLPALIEQATKRRPEVQSLEARVRAGSDAVNLARAAWYPQVSATGDLTYARPNSRNFPPQDKFTPSWDVGVGASFAVWNWGQASHQTAEARAQLRQVQVSLTQLKNAIALQVTQDFLALQKAQAEVIAADTAVVQAAENQQVAHDGFEAGTALNSDLLDAEVNLLQAQLNLAQSRAGREISRAKLAQTLGEQ